MMSPFARTIMEHKYAHDTEEGKETWDQIAYRVTKNTLKAVGITMREAIAKNVQKAISERKFIPGGRYLYACGRPFHQTQNCLLLKAIDSREGWADLLHNAAMALMTGAGIGVDYSDVRHRGSRIRKTGGQATGPIALMQMLNECGRGIMQGGSRRSAIWAGLNWNHGDIHEFIGIKNWNTEIRRLKEGDFNFPATLDQTNISVLLDDAFFEAYGDPENELHPHAHSVYWATVKQMLKTAEPGFSVDIGKNSGETLRNAPVSEDTRVLTDEGYKSISEIKNIPTTIWTGKQWTKNVVFKKTRKDIQTIKVRMKNGRTIKADPSHEFFVERVQGKGTGKKISIEKVATINLKSGDNIVVSLPKTKVMPFDSKMYTLGYIYGDGSFSGNRAELTLCSDESKQCLHRMVYDSITETDSRGYTRIYFHANDDYIGRNKKTCPQECYNTSFIAGLFDADGCYSPDYQRVRLASIHKEFLEGVQEALEFFGIESGIHPAGKGTFKGTQCWLLVIRQSSIKHFAELIPTCRLKILCDDYRPYRQFRNKIVSIEKGPVEDVYCCDVHCSEHSFCAEGVIISNCTEVSSSDDSDICNLGSINLARVETLDEFKQLIEIGIIFLLAGTVYSDVPYPKVDQVRTKNRRLGLGLMGVHEWLLKRGKRYDVDDELNSWLKEYVNSTGIARKYAKAWEISIPKKTRSIAPTGTIGIVAETTTGIEPIFCVSFKRRYLKGTQWHYQYVVDPTARRLISTGIDPEDIEDAYSILPEKRIGFQAWVQGYVDHAISSTVNLPSWGSEYNNSGLVMDFGNMLMKYLPRLRGITVYPDGARGGQPLVPVSYLEAIKHEGIELVEESTDVCSLTRGGLCGD